MAWPALRRPPSGRHDRSARGNPIGGGAGPLPTKVFEQELADLRRRRERLLDLAEVDDLARDLASRLQSLAARITQTEAELATANGAKEDIIDLRATLSQMTDVAQEVLGGGADQRSLRDFYVALRLRVDYDPSTRIASATITWTGPVGEASVSEGGLEPPCPVRGTSASS